MKRIITYKKFFWIALCLCICAGCTKLVQVPEPNNTITTSETFATDGNAESAVVGIYNSLMTGYNFDFDYGNGVGTLYMGVSADELLYYSTNTLITEFQYNQLEQANLYLDQYFWAAMYYNIYQANAAIEGLQSSGTLTPSLKSQLLGEAYFLRAYIYFYLVNIFRNVPLVTTTTYAQTQGLPNANPSAVYTQMESDLQVAEGLLPTDYSAGGGERYRVNSWGAAAMLARIYLYEKKYSQADSAASAVIGNTNLFGLVSDPNAVFLANSTEAIWQLLPNQDSYFATDEAYKNLPNPANTGVPTYYLTTTLLNAFDSGDLRRTDWVDSTVYRGRVYYYPYKYKVKVGAAGNIAEYYMMLRLAEQYLIRAEADANGAGGGPTQAMADLSTIRERANLPAYTGPNDLTDLMTAIAHERQVELFAEWGHRWADLNRWGNAAAVLSATKGFTVRSSQLNWPIPINDLDTDPNLVQNTGY